MSAIQAYCDTETQNRRWCDPKERNPHFTLEECVITYFDDVLYSFDGEFDLYRPQVGRGHVSSAEAEAVREFHMLADVYQPPNGDFFDGSATVADPVWQRVVAAAQQAQRRLLELLDDPNEISALTQPPEWQDEDGVFRSSMGTVIVPAGPGRA